MKYLGVITLAEKHSKGGIARAASLSPGERSEIAHKAAVARWSGKMLSGERRYRSLKSVSPEELEQMLKDRDFWVSIIPEGATIKNFTQRKYASILMCNGEVLSLSTGHIEWARSLGAQFPLD